MSKVKLDTPQIRKINREEVFAFIRKNPNTTKSEIITSLELSRPTVVNIVEELESAGLIKKEKNPVNTGGRSAMSYSCNPGARLAIGIQLSQRHIRGVVVDLLGNVLGNVKRRIIFHVDEAYRQEIGSVYRQLLEESSLDEQDVAGVGITVQALTDSEGTQVTYIPIKSHVGAKCEGLTKYIPGKSRLFHDLLALGYNQNLWVDKNVFYLSINSSIGGTILIKDEVYYGNSNKAGEVGHLQLVQNGRKCYCGNHGCFDAYCNTMNLMEFAGGTLEDFFMGVAQKKEGYSSFWEEYKEYLATAVFSIRILFDGTIMLGGELGKFANYYLDNLRDRLDEKAFFPGERASEYVFAYEEGEYAIAVGAAMYYIENVLDEF